MSEHSKPTFEELDYQQTAMGELILQRRTVIALDHLDVYEVKLNEEYLMSTLFHDAEVALSDIGLGMLAGEDWEVVVGGLGLGYTAAAALAHPQLARLVVVEALEPVIDWHRRELVPNGALLTNDPRCTWHHADFFELTRGDGYDPDAAGHAFDAVLLDIDHTPDYLLTSSHADFYTEEGLQRLKSFIKPGGVFAMWSNDPADDRFLKRLRNVFGNAENELITFENPLQQSESVNSVYTARR